MIFNSKIFYRHPHPPPSNPCPPRLASALPRIGREISRDREIKRSRYRDIEISRDQEIERSRYGEINREREIDRKRIEIVMREIMRVGIELSRMGAVGIGTG